MPNPREARSGIELAGRGSVRSRRDGGRGGRIRLGFRGGRANRSGIGAFLSLARARSRREMARREMAVDGAAADGDGDGGEGEPEPFRKFDKK